MSLAHGPRRSGRVPSDAAAAIDVDRVRLVGFTSSFQQNAASLGLARLLKQRRPELTVVFGGANCRAELGPGIADSDTTFIDAVCTGEGDLCFPLFVSGSSPRASCPWTCGNGDAGSDRRRTRKARSSPTSMRCRSRISTISSSSMRGHADRRCVPSAGGAVRNVARMLVGGEASLHVLRHQRQVDGLPSQVAGTGVRRNRMARASARSGSRQRGCDPRHAVFRDVAADVWRELETPITAYYELKANLRPDQFERLARAGILKIQPGIESLDTDILIRRCERAAPPSRTFRRSSSAAEHGLFVEWNFLTGFPGETTEHYRRMAG